MSITQEITIAMRRPDKEDGLSIWQFVREFGGLDLNSAYAYLMMCDMFPATCAVAWDANQLAGFVIGYRKPAQPDCLFIWQVGVNPSHRGRGIGLRLLEELLQREDNANIRCVEATVGPNNAASRGLFLRLAAKHDTGCIVTEHYQQHLFPDAEAHEAELLYRIGPLTNKKEVIE